MLIVDHEMQQNAEMSAEKDHPRTIRWLPSLLLLAAALVVRRCCSRYYPPPVLPSVVVVTGRYPIMRLIHTKGQVHQCGLSSPLVAGASSGIGRHAAVHLADQGFTVLAGVRKQADAESLKEEGLSDLHPIILDVTKDEDIRSAVRQAQSYGLPVVGLINNAGVGYPMPVELVKMERVRDVFEVNVLSLVALVKAFTPLLRASKGRIINLGSVTGTLAAQSDGIYAASKHAVEGLTDAMRLELRKWDISVSLIIPGQVSRQTSLALLPLCI